MDSERFAAAITRAAEAGKQVGMSQGFTQGAALAIGIVGAGLIAYSFLTKRQQPQQALSEPAQQLPAPSKSYLPAYDPYNAVGAYLF